MALRKAQPNTKFSKYVWAYIWTNCYGKNVFFVCYEVRYIECVCFPSVMSQEAISPENWQIPVIK